MAASSRVNQLTSPSNAHRDVEALLIEGLEPPPERQRGQEFRRSSTFKSKTPYREEPVSSV